MKTIVNLLKKVPAALRYPVLVVLAFLSFYLGFNGLTEGNVAQAVIGVPLFLLVIVIFYTLIANKEQA